MKSFPSGHAQMSAFTAAFVIVSIYNLFIFLLLQPNTFVLISFIRTNVFKLLLPHSALSDISALAEDQISSDQMGHKVVLLSHYWNQFLLIIISWVSFTVILPS